MTPFYLSRDEVREIDRRAVEGFGVPGVVLMENAGRGCAELLMRLNPDRKLAVILCGPGNNGGDGFVIARHLDNCGWSVSSWLFAPAEDPSPDRNACPRLAPDNRTNYSIWDWCQRITWVNTREWQRDWGWHQQLSTELSVRTWVVDALFGTGLDRALGAPFESIAEMVNASGNPVLAVDIPSGLDCDTGEQLGPTVKATHTATFVAHKKGFLNPVSRQWTGEVHVIDIGAPRVLLDEYRRRRESAPPPATPEP